MQPIVTSVECICGVRYIRSERRLSMKDVGLFDCIECGARIECWSSRNVPVFTRSAERRSEAKRA